MADKKEKVAETLPPVVKKPKRAQAMAECSFVDFYKDCRVHVEFLQKALQDPLLNKDIVLRYATIYALIRIGENLTFLRDDEKFPYKNEMEEWKRSQPKPKPSIELAIIMGFIFFRNQLLHHNPYKPKDSEDSRSIETIVHEALQGRFDRPTGIIALKDLLEQKLIAQVRTFCSDDAKSIESLVLCKPMGVPDPFKYNIHDCLDALSRETKALDVIQKESRDVNAVKAGYLRCFQIIDDLAKLDDSRAMQRQQPILTVEILDTYGEMLKQAKEARKILAHVLSYTSVEIDRIEALLKTIKSSELMQFSAVVNAGLEDDLKEQRHHVELPPLPDDFFGPVATKGLSKTLTIPLGMQAIEIPTKDGKPPQPPITVQRQVEQEAAKIPTMGTMAVVTKAAQPQQPEENASKPFTKLVDYSSSSSSDEDEVDKTEKKGDTKKRKPPK